MLNIIKRKWFKSKHENVGQVIITFITTYKFRGGMCLIVNKTTQKVAGGFFL